MTGVQTCALPIYTDTYQAPGTATTSGFGQVYGNTMYYQGTTTYQPGATFSKPRMAFDLKLADLSTGEIVWIGSAFTRGNAFADLVAMADSVGQTAAAELLREGLVRPKPRVGQ